MARTEAGITLIELMAALAIAAIVVAIGFPSFSQALQRQRVSTTMHHLRADMAMARSSAVMRRSQVIVCPLDGFGGCATDRDWSRGWMVFGDADGDGMPDDEHGILRITEAPGGGALALAGSRTLLRYQSDGRAAGANLTVYVCTETGYAGKVVVNNLGRVRGERARESGLACPR